MTEDLQTICPPLNSVCAYVCERVCVGVLKKEKGKQSVCGRTKEGEGETECVCVFVRERESMCICECDHYYNSRRSIPKMLSLIPVCQQR